MQRSPSLAARALTVLAAVVIAFGLTVAPAGAITGGEPDNWEHPQTGIILALYDDGSGYLCSGSLIAPSVLLTAGHCTVLFDQEGFKEVLISFDESIDFENGTFYRSREWYTHPDYVDADWPFTQDFGVVILKDALDLPLAELPYEGMLYDLIPDQGASDQGFVDVGYGQTGVDTGGGPPQPSFPLDRRQSTQTYHPGGNDYVGVIHGLTDTLLMLKANPSSRHGSGCGGDSGGPIFLEGTYTLAAIHTGGYRLGFDGALCGRLSSLNHRLDTATALNWLYQFL